MSTPSNLLNVNPAELPPRLAMRVPAEGVRVSAHPAPMTKVPTVQGRKVTRPIHELTQPQSYQEGNLQPGMMQRAGEIATQASSWIVSGASSLAASFQARHSADPEVKRAALVKAQLNHADSVGLNGAVLGKENLEGLQPENLTAAAAAAAEGPAPAPKSRTVQVSEAKAQIQAEAARAAQMNAAIKGLAVVSSDGNTKIKPSQIKK